LKQFCSVLPAARAANPLPSKALSKCFQPFWTHRKHELPSKQRLNISQAPVKALWKLVHFILSIIQTYPRFEDIKLNLSTTSKRLGEVEKE